MSAGEGSSREAVKRRLMFVAGEDFYFLGYTLLLLLSELNATSAARALRDSRKLAYIADFIGSDADLQLATTASRLSDRGRARLCTLYDRAVARRLPLERLLEALARRQLVVLTRSPGDPDQVHAIEADHVKGLVTNGLYAKERERIQALRTSLPQLRTMTLSTVQQRLFADKGVRTWGV